MRFEDAQEFDMPFGKYKGLSIDQVSMTNEGVLYLDWLIGEDLYGTFQDALESFMEDPMVQRDVKIAMSTQ